MATEMGFDNGFVEKLMSVGSKGVENANKIGEISLAALKQVVDSQMQLASAFVELSTGQCENLSQVTAPTVFLQRQKELGESFGEKVNGYVENLRRIGTDTQAAYTAAAQSFTAEAGLKSTL